MSVCVCVRARALCAGVWCVCCGFVCARACVRVHEHVRVCVRMCVCVRALSLSCARACVCVGRSACALQNYELCMYPL